MLLHEFSTFIEVSLFVNLFLGGATTILGFVVKYVSTYVLASLISQALGRFKIDQVIKFFYKIPIALAVIQAVIVIFLGWGYNMSDIIQKDKKLKEGWEGISRFFRANSIWMLMYCTGCCAIELPQAMTSRYDMERLGMGPMATPRQADVLLVTGYLSVKTLRRVIYAYEQMSNAQVSCGVRAVPDKRRHIL